MKSIRNHSLLRTLALGALLICLGATIANAQPFHGTFSLPTEVRWGAAVLPAGDYAFTYEGVRSGNMLQVFQSGKAMAVVLPTALNSANGGAAVLVVYREKTGWTVREIRLPDSGVKLYYAPSISKHGSAAEEREVARLIPISTSAAAR